MSTTTASNNPNGRTTIVRRIVSQPVLLFLLPCLLSFLAWCVPQETYGRIWRTSELDISLADLEPLIIWLLMMTFAILAGTGIGQWFSRSDHREVDFDRQFFIWYYVVLFAGWIGTSAEFAQIIQARGLAFILTSFSRGLGNNVKETLYENYSVGLASLRYLNIISGGVGIYLLLVRKGNLVLNIFNVAFMVTTALISFRLSLIAAAVVFLVIYGKVGMRVRSATILTMVASVLTLLTVANASRNSNYYAASGIDNPAMASVTEAMAYLSSPFQGALAASDMVSSGNLQENIGIDETLTTNSGFLELVRSPVAYTDTTAATANKGGSHLLQSLAASGVSAPYVIAPLVAVLFAALFTWAFRSRSLALLAGAGGWGYAFCELWRIYMFGEGVWIVLFVFGLVLPLVINFWVPPEQPSVNSPRVSLSERTSADKR